MPTYYECGICGQLHSATWNGDCRQDDARFNPEELDARHGQDGWREIVMDDVDAYQLGRISFFEA